MIIRWISDVPSKIVKIRANGRAIGIPVRPPIGLFNGAPDLSKRSEEILREEFAKRADADR